jgi:hypothetical protein
MKKKELKLSIFADRLKKLAAREAKETKVASNILIKLLNYHFKISKVKPSDKEIHFLKEHSIDLFKILPMIIMFPTPIPYIEIAVLLKTIGFDYLLPKSEGLVLPTEEQSTDLK